MPIGSSELERLILRIHSAALAEDAWSQIGDDVRRALRADGASLVRPNRRTTIKPWCRLFEFDGTFVSEYTDYWGQHDVWYHGAVRTQRIGVGLINVGDQLIERREYRQTPFYNEYLRRMNIDGMINVCLSAPDADYGPTALTLYRGPGTDSFAADEVALLSHLAPHLTVAAQNYWAARSLRLLRDAYRNALDSVTAALFGIDSSGRVAFTNGAAEALLRQRRWVQVVDGSLEAVRSVKEVGSLARALRALSAGTSFKLMITDGLTGAQAILSGVPVSPAETNPYPATVAALIWLMPIVPDADGAADLAKLFGLTLAERRLVSRLILGDDLREAAETLHISLHTARTQLKAIFNKTGRRTQAALLALAMRLSNLRTPIP